MTAALLTRPVQPRVRRADPVRDNAALCSLARLCPQGRAVQFLYDRSDHWERCRLFDRGEVLLAEHGGEAVGAATVGYKTLWGPNGPLRAAYFFDRMVHPAARRRGVARALLRAQLERTAACDLQYCLTLEDNEANRGLLESEGFVARRPRLLYLAILPALPRGRSRAACRVARWQACHGEPVPRDRPHLTPRPWLQDGYTLVDDPTRSGDEVVSLGAEHEPAASAVVYRHGGKRFTRVPWLAGVLGRLVRGLPAPGRVVASWSLTHLRWQDEASFAELSTGVAREARRAGVGLVLLPVYEDDPRLETVRRRCLPPWALQPTRVCLYAHGPAAPAVLQAATPLLASGRDG